MTFQLVRASDTGIVVWQIDHGHIYGYSVCPETDSLTQRFMREAPEASAPAEDFTEGALRYAEELARARQLIGGRAKGKAGCSRELA